MSPFIKSCLEIFKARLSRRIVFWIFISIVIVEGVILIPSVQRRERELLTRLREVSAGKVHLLFKLAKPDVSDQDLLQQVQQLNSTTLIGEVSEPEFNLVNTVEFNPIILGGTLYKSDGQVIGSFGEPPRLLAANITQGADVTAVRSQDGNRYDVAWSATKLNRNSILILTLDSTSVKTEYFAFILRIIGLVIIIGIFTTAGSMIALGQIMITPILLLREDLVMAGEAISQDREPPMFYSTAVQRHDELGYVVNAFNRMFQQISDAISDRKQAEAALQESLKQVEAYSRALNYELEKGRQMQTNFLPAELLQKPNWEVAAFFKPARQVAGDFYDVFELPGDRIGLVIADVCDKGVGAALFMALFRSLIRIFSGQTALDGLSLPGQQDIVKLADMHEAGLITGNEHGFDPINALQAVSLTSNYVARNHGELGMFATLFFGVLDPDTGLLNYINGGHEALFVIDDAGGIKHQLKSTGPAVGMLPNLKFKIQQVVLEVGDILLGYTDGVPEARDLNGKFFTDDRLKAMLENPTHSASVLLENIAASVLEHTGTADQFDDITLLALRRKAPISET